jgi:hypothetical protein
MEAFDVTRLAGWEWSWGTHQSPDAVVRDPVLLWYKCNLAANLAAARRQAYFSQQRCQEAALAAAICAGQHYERASRNIQRKTMQHCSAYKNQEDLQEL